MIEYALLFMGLLVLLISIAELRQARSIKDKLNELDSAEIIKAIAREGRKHEQIKK